MANWLDIKGTSKDQFRIGKNKWNVDASAATALRQFVLGDLPVDLTTGGTNDVLTRGATSISFQPAGAGSGYTYYSTNQTLSGDIQGDVVFDAADLTGLTAPTTIRGNLYLINGAAATIDDSLTVQGSILSVGTVEITSTGNLQVHGDLFASTVNLEGSALIAVQGDCVLTAALTGGGTTPLGNDINIQGDLITGAVSGASSAVTVDITSGVGSMTLRVGGSLHFKNAEFSGAFGIAQVDVEVGGDLISTRTDNSFGQFNINADSTSSPSLRVRGAAKNLNILSASTTNDDSKSGANVVLGSFSGGYVSIAGNGNLASGTNAGGTGGNFTCFGDVDALYVKCDGGPTADVTLLGGDGGDILIYGSANIRSSSAGESLTTKGGSISGAGGAGGGGSGGNIEVFGSCSAYVGPISNAGDYANGSTNGNMVFHGDLAVIGTDVEARCLFGKLPVNGGSVAIYGNFTNLNGGINVAGSVGFDTGPVAGGNGGLIEINGTAVCLNLIANGGNGDASGGDGGQVTVRDCKASTINISGGSSGAIEGSTGELISRHHLSLRTSLVARDGSGGGTAPTATKNIFFNGTTLIRLLNFQNRAGVKMRPENDANNGTPVMLKVDAFGSGSKTEIDFHDGSGNVDISAGAADSLYVYSYDAISWNRLQPSAGGGSGYTYFAGSTALTGIYDGDVFVGGSVTDFSTSVEIRGNLYVLGDIEAATSSTNLLVHGSIFVTGEVLSVATGANAIEVRGDLRVGGVNCYLRQGGGSDFIVGRNLYCDTLYTGDGNLTVGGSIFSSGILNLGYVSGGGQVNTVRGDIKAVRVFIDNGASSGTSLYVGGSMHVKEDVSAASSVANFFEVVGDVVTGEASTDSTGTLVLQAFVDGFTIKIGGSVVAKNAELGTSNSATPFKGVISIGGNLTCSRKDTTHGALNFGTSYTTDTDWNELHVGGSIVGFDINGKGTQQGHGSNLYCGAISSHLNALVEVDLRGRDKTLGGAARGGGDLQCGGSCSGNVKTRGGGHSSVTSGNGKGGSVYIAGDCHGTIITGEYQGAGDYGGPANDITVLGSVYGTNGVKAEPGLECDVDDPASIDIHGDTFGQVSARGYSSNSVGLSGGTVLIRGSAWAGAMAAASGCSLSCGVGGSIQINGNCKGGVDTTGGSDSSESTTGGNGGNISIYGALVDGDVRLSGGQGSTGGDAGHLVLGGPSQIGYLEMNGGLSATQNGNCGSCVTQSIACVEFHARDGQGAGAAPSTTKRLIMSGDIRIGQMDFEARGTVFWRPANASPGIPTTLKVDSFAAGSDTFIDNHDESADRDLAGAIQDYFYFYSASALAWYGVQGT